MSNNNEKLALEDNNGRGDSIFSKLIPFSGMLTGLFTTVTNTVFNSILASSNKDIDLGHNIVSMVCVVSNDLPVDVRNRYCKSLEVMYAVMLKSIISLFSLDKSNVTARELFRSFPLLTAFDNIEFNKDLNSYQSTMKAISKSSSGKKALDTFTESMIERIKNEFDGQEIVSMESILKESKGAVPTYIEVEAVVYNVDGRTFTKKFVIGVEVRPSVVEPSDVVSMLIKQNKKGLETVSDDKKTMKWFDKMKMIFISSAQRIKKEIPKEDLNNIKSINDTMNAIRGIKKPFVNVLISGMCENMLEDAKMKITDKNVITNLYNSLPLASVGIYNINTDTINITMNRSPFFVKRTSGEFDSEISKYERELSQLVNMRLRG